MINFRTPFRKWRWAFVVSAVLIAVFAWLFAPIVSPRSAVAPNRSSRRMVTITVAGIIPQESLLVAGEASWVQSAWIATGRPPVFFSSLNRVYYFKDAAMQQDGGEVVLEPAWWWTPNQLPITGQTFTIKVPANIVRLAQTLRR